MLFKWYWIWNLLWECVRWMLNWINNMKCSSMLFNVWSCVIGICERVKENFFIYELEEVCVYCLGFER